MPDNSLYVQLDKLGTEVTAIIREVALGNNPGPIVDRLLQLKDPINRLKAVAA